MKISITITFLASINVSKYSVNDLQRIFKTVLEIWATAPTLTSTPASVVSKAPQDKLKACFSDVYHEKFHMDFYNFCQQCEDYFGITGATDLPKFVSPYFSFKTGSVSTGSNTRGSKI